MQDTEEIILRGTFRNDLYVFFDFVLVSEPSTNVSSVSPANNSYTLWHARFKHANATVIHHIMQQCNVTFNAKHTFCDSCIVGKAHQLPFLDSHTVYTAPLQLIFIGIWGLSPIPSSDGSYYYIAFFFLCI